MGTAYANEYDADGRLIASTATPYGPGNSNVSASRTTFEDDSDGRCHRLETQSTDVSRGG